MLAERARIRAEQSSSFRRPMTISVGVASINRVACTGGPGGAEKAGPLRSISSPAGSSPVDRPSAPEGAAQAR